MMVTMLCCSSIVWWCSNTAVQCLGDCSSYDCPAIQPSGQQSSLSRSSLLVFPLLRPQWSGRSSDCLYAGQCWPQHTAVDTTWSRHAVMAVCLCTDQCCHWTFSGIINDTLSHLFPLYFFLSFIGFTCFLLLSIPFLSTRIVPLRFQAGGRRSVFKPRTWV